jgi:hypothetical protein
MKVKSVCEKVVASSWRVMRRQKKSLGLRISRLRASLGTRHDL